MNNAVGTLYVVGTPIGNLEDMSFRAVRILKEVDLIAAEDTRHSVKLLNHFDIHTKMTAYHKFNETAESEKLCRLLNDGMNIALISDAGMPVISDPGFILISKCQEEGIPITVIPGPNAALCGIVLSGMDCRHFTFLGFLEKSNKAMTEGINHISQSSLPTVLYESPHRLTKTLTLLSEKIPHREMAAVREITKQYEEVKKGTASELLSWFQDHPPKGEFVLIISGRGEKDDCVDNSSVNALNRLSLTEHFDYYVRLGQTEKEAMKSVAKDRGISRREVYATLKVQ